MSEYLAEKKRIDELVPFFKQFLFKIKDADEVSVDDLTKASKRIIKLIGDEDIKEMPRILNGLSGKFLIALETIENEHLAYVESRREGQKNQYTPAKAGFYIAKKIGRTTPISKAMVNKYITEGELLSTKKGTYNYIYEYDLDDFIERKLKAGGFRNINE